MVSEIKATSVPVSVCMFLGCYLLLAFIPTVLMKGSPFVCNLQAWLSGVGLSTLLIFATLFVKMLRVYMIFMKPLSFKRKLLSNPALLVYILLILCPQILILLLWYAIDTYVNLNFEFIEDHRLVTGDSWCGESNYISIWITLLVLYLFLITLILVIFAFKTSKIRYKNFQDTKATNAYTFLSVYITITGLIYWYFFRSLSLDATFSSIVKTATTLCISHDVLAILCPTFLFVPKVYPPLKRYFSRNTVKNKDSSLKQ